MQLSNQYPSLKDRVVLITGGATGIGACMVEAFSRQQARVAFVDIQDAPAQALLERVAVSGAAHAPRYFHCDLLDIAGLREVIGRVRAELGPVAVLVNNAADDTRHDFRSIDVEYWNERINVNMRHAFFAIQAVNAQMVELGGGSIINLGSISWHAMQGGMTGYTTAKAGLEGMTRGLARELGADGIRINALVPGWVMTERQLREWVNAAAEREIDSNQCLRGRLQPQDIAAMALFLASDDSKMCTAQNFVVDGGWI
jgi:NAD(P)-dependent dehydrogenase (short-subunit alcohol dehydrogenase family)